MTDVAWWQVAAVTNGIVAVAYAAIAITIGRGIVIARQWRHNPLAVATAAIFTTCAVHHGSHSAHMLFFADGHHGASMRAAFDNVFMGGWDVLSAAAAIWYWRLRSNFPALLRGAALFDDLEVRRRQALELHDGVVQGLAAAKLQLELGHQQEALAAMEATMAVSKQIITGLLVDADNGFRPDVLQRERPSGPTNGTRE